MNKTILIVDDEADIVELITYNLKKEGFRIIAAPDGEAGLDQIRKSRFDLVILDLMLPGIQGVELCRMIRNNPKTEALPIIMLTAKAEEADKIRGLETGADDYMTKPFSPKELVARVRALIRRTGEGLERDKVITLGDLRINTATYAVMKRNEQLSLSATEFRLLLFLAERKGRIFSRDQLLDAVWKDETFVGPRTVDVHIRRLRAQIEDHPEAPVHIKTRRGVGYYAE